MSELLTLTGLGLFSMLAEMFNIRKAIYPVVLIGLAALLGFCYLDWNTNLTHYAMMRTDNYSLAFTGVIGATALLWFLMSKSYFEDETNMSDHFSLVLFALVGAFCLTSYTNLVMLFVGVEVLSIPLYVLVGSRKRDIASNEASFKYFLMGAFASAFLLFGMTFLYGAVGSFDIDAIGVYLQANSQPSGLFIVGILLILIALAFKVSAAPFHFWAPDVYQGAPTVITTFMATIVKTAAIAGFFRLFSHSFQGAEGRYADALWAMAALTMVVGNITAAIQTNVKRMLAFSSVGHAGFMLIAILVMSKTSAQTILYYTAAYSASSLAAFLVLYLIGSVNEGQNNIENFNGLVKRNPLMAGTMTMALLSMAGIPPLAGFFAKYFIFIEAINNFQGLVIIGILSSLVGVYYYFKIIIAMFFGEKGNQPLFSLTPIHKFLLIILNLIIIGLGILPHILPAI
jgi:NADH-quinone oxidoreductase subunit N